MTGMTDEQALAWWDALPAETRERVDGEVRAGRNVQAVKLLLDVDRGDRRAGVGIHQGMAILSARVARVGPPAAPPQDTAELVRRATATGDRLLAVEAVWAGDTVRDRHVLLLAVGERGDHVLTAVDAGTARHHGSTVAAAADRIGRELAAALGLPFHFAGPDEPDDDAPRGRWR
ncbi:hypothetical protein GCM10009759_73970 [Kitasatospora saccharophila]|uniref:TLP18.3/Psb32/MOLO-1 phosphatase superfamily protein n=1 Tax=Kitasatospora saccharophila TaxID=407973 RepID=A0ABN2Y7L4_9ACTN